MQCLNLLCQSDSLLVSQLVTKLKYRFFGHTINKEEFKFSVKAYSYKDAASELFRMLNVNYVWLLNCEMPGKHSHMNYHAGKTHSIDLTKYQKKN